MNEPTNIWGWLFWLVPNLITTCLWVSALRDAAHAKASAKMWRYAALGAVALALFKGSKKEGGQL